MSQFGQLIFVIFHEAHKHNNHNRLGITAKIELNRTIFRVIKKAKRNMTPVSKPKHGFIFIS